MKIHDYKETIREGLGARRRNEFTFLCGVQNGLAAASLIAGDFKMDLARNKVFQELLNFVGEQFDKYPAK